MSNWTHIHAIIKIEQIYCFDSGDKQFKKFREKITERLSKAPLITGSERNADIIPIKFSKTIYCGNDDNDENVNCVHVAIIGDLRDRTVKQTKNEYKKFVKYFSDVDVFSDDVFSVEELVYQIRG